MSLENLKEYASRCATDPDLLVAAKSIGIADIEEHIRHAGSLGLDWTKDDLVAFRKEITDDGFEDLADLTEDELEQVAGGGIFATIGAAVAVGVGVGAGVAAVAGAAGAGGAAAAGRGGW